MSTAPTVVRVSIEIETGTVTVGQAGLTGGLLATPILTCGPRPTDMSTSAAVVEVAIQVGTGTATVALA